MLVDSHCHLDFDDTQDSSDALIERAKQAGVDYLLAISTGLEDVGRAIAVAEKHAGVFASVGLHPENVDSANPLDCELLYPYLANSKVIGIGECGLDYHYEGHDKEAQKRDFLTQIRLAQERPDMVLIIHNRDSDQDMLEILRREQKIAPFKMLLHCFASDIYFARATLDLGAYFSFSGIITFKNAAAVQEVAKFVPDDRIMVETDSPFLAPDPFRGKTCEPAYTRYTAERLAELRGVDIKVIEEKTTENFFTLFERASKI